MLPNMKHLRNLSDSSDIAHVLQDLPGAYDAAARIGIDYLNHPLIVSFGTGDLRRSIKTGGRPILMIERLVSPGFHQAASRVSTITFDESKVITPELRMLDGMNGEEVWPPMLA